jgi:hypothetical protein
MARFISFGFRLLGALGIVMALGAGSASDSACAQERSGVALSVQASTMGPGMGLHVGVTEGLRVQARGAFLPYSLSRDITDEDVDARVNADLQIGGPELRLDWHPFASAFHVSAGALYNLVEADGRVFPISSFEFSDEKTFDREKIGDMDATVSYSLPVSPYLGLGFGDALSGRWSFAVEAGAYYAGSPEVDLEGKGLIKPTEQNEATLEKGLESFQFIPSLSFGLSYQF